MTDFTVKDVRPSEVEAYLTSRHWRLINEVTHGAIWEYSDESGERVDLFVPRRTDFADYERRLVDLVQTLTAVEDRTAEDVMRDLVEASAAFFNPGCTT